MKRQQAQISAHIFEYRRQILEHHLDSYGHVNNAVYLQIYEEARWDFITTNGYGHQQVMECQLGPVILECQVKFQVELVNRQWIVLKSWCSLLPHPLLYTIHQEIWTDQNVLASQAQFTGGLMDLQKRKLVRPSTAWLQAMGFTGKHDAHLGQSGDKSHLDSL